MGCFIYLAPFIFRLAYKPEELTKGLACMFYTWTFYKKHPISSVSFIPFTKYIILKQ